MLDEEHIYKKQVQGEKIKLTKLHPQFGSARDLLETSDDFNTPIAFDENS